MNQVKISIRARKYYRRTYRIAAPLTYILHRN